VTAPPLPQIVSQPVSRTNGAGSVVTFTVGTVYGVPGQTRWLFNEMPLLGAVGPSLVLSNIQLADAGSYRVVVANYSGSVTSAVALLVVPSTLPSIVSAPQNLAVPEGLPALFTVSAVGSEPLAYQWRLNDADFPGATNVALVIPTVMTSDLGFYRVVITNAEGAVTSSPALLTLTTVTSWGTNDFLRRNIPIEATNLLALAAGDNHVLSLRADGSVLAWGDNACGQTTVPASASNIVRVAACGLHSLALQDDGTVLDLFIHGVFEHRLELIKITSQKSSVVYDRALKAIFGIHILEGIQLMWTSNNQFFPLIFIESLDVVFRHHLEETFFPGEAL